MEQKHPDLLCLHLSIDGKSQPSKSKVLLRWAEAGNGLRVLEGNVCGKAPLTHFAFPQFCPGLAP